ncbi:MAG: RNA polymerase sigma factor [Acidobacteriota bacterium]
MDELKDLARRARAGDASAFEELVEKRKERAVYLAYQILGDWEEARDAAQGAFIKLWQQIGSFDERYPFDLWFRRIVTNQAIDQYRKTRVRRDAVRKDSEEPPPAPPPAISPSGRISHEEVQRVFEEAARTLAPQQRAVFVLREIEDLSPREIAEALAITESTVRNHLFKARAVLREYIRLRYPEYAPPARRDE